MNDIKSLPKWLTKLSELRDLNLEHNINLEWIQNNLRMLKTIKDKGGIIKNILYISYIIYLLKVIIPLIFGLLLVIFPKSNSHHP